MISIRWVTWWPAPYWITRFNYLTDSDDVDLKVCFLAAGSTIQGWEVNRSSWTFKHVILNLKCDSSGYYGVKYRFPRPGKLVQGNFDALIITYADVTCITAALLCKLLKKPYYLFVPNTKYDDRKYSLFKEYLKQVLFRNATGILATGPLQKEYAQKYVKNKGKIAVIGNPVVPPGERYNDKIRNVLRKKYGLKEPVLLYVGRLGPEKGLFTLVDALSMTYKRGIQPTLVLAGAGPLESELRAEASKRGLIIKFVGFLQQDELARRYATADIFVLPSQSEAWGLVVNEAMEFELPLILSSHVGSVPVLLKEGKNGLSFPVGDSNALALCIERLCSDKSLRQNMGRVSSDIIKNNSIQNWAKAVLSAIRDHAG